MSIVKIYYLSDHSLLFRIISTTVNNTNLKGLETLKSGILS